MFYIFFRFLNFSGTTTSTPTSKLTRFFGKLLSSANSADIMDPSQTQPIAKEKPKPRREIVLTGVVASLLLYISVWQLLEIVIPTKYKALAYSSLAVLSAAVLFFLLEKYPKILG